jgi:hypothetical protein
VITPRVTRLLRAADLRALQRTIVATIPRGWEARASAVIVPTRSAAEELRRRIEDLTLADGGDSACLMPDLITRDQLYHVLHGRLAGAPPLLTAFEREVLLRLAAADAEAEGAAPPFRLRPGLVVAVLRFYDELRRRRKSIDTFDRTLRAHLEPGSDTDKGAARLLHQTRFLSAAFAAFERRVGDSGRIDEHGLRDLLLTNAQAAVYRHIVVAVADEPAESSGLWPVDFDLLSRLHGVARLDIVATEHLLAAGLHQRLHEVLPGIEETRVTPASAAPVLLGPAADGGHEPRLSFVCRDREEELADAARWIKQRVRAEKTHALDRTVIVFQRPLPYLYLARNVFGSARIPYQTADALPLAAEPFAAAVDLIFAVAVEEASRTAVVELLRSPFWTFEDPSHPGRPLDRQQVSALDRFLREAKYLGGGSRLQQLAEGMVEHGSTRESARWRQAGPALRAAVAIQAELDLLRTSSTASQQLDVMLTFAKRHERPAACAADQPDAHLRARAAIFGALASLREAHVRHDDRPLEVADLVATVRRWIEGQTFSPRTGREGVLLADTLSATFVDAAAVRMVGLVDADWPERASGSIFYPAALLRELGWPAESERLAASRARFLDLLLLAGEQVSLSTFTLENDALVAPSPFLDEVGQAGLVVERPAPAPARIFEHEALAIAPVVRGGLPEISNAWLTLRLSRTPLLDARYHGLVGARAPAVYAVSRVERYLECPFKYFAGHVLGLEEEREDESGLTPRERGQLLHGVFEAFFVAWRERSESRITTDNLSEAVGLFADVAEAQLAALPDADRALERTYLLGSAASPGLAERAFAFEIEHGVEVRERLLEYEFEGSFRIDGPEAPRQVRLRGKADRIDLLADGTLRVVDYKLGRAPKPARSLQLPIYSICASQSLEGRLGHSWSIGRAGYVAFREKNAFVELGGRGGNLQAALADGQRRFLEAITRIEAGEFPPSPDEPWTCTRCGFPHVCRKDYVGDE